MDTAAALARYAEAFERLTPESLPGLRDICRADVAFVDPFNEIQGIDGFIAVFEHMYETTEEPRFHVLDQAVGRAVGVGYLKWRMTGRAKGRSFVIDIVGMSEVVFDEAGLVARHVDHWDAASQLYARLPLVGPVIRWLGRRFALDDRRE
jgi:steroid delta-isomerase